MRRLCWQRRGPGGPGPFLVPVTMGVALAVLAGCASAPPTPAPGRAPGTVLPPPGPRLPAPGKDGPEANPPPDLDKVPDAEPRIEQPRAGGPNKPYDVLGQSYVPVQGDAPVVERGLASWYGRKFHGRPTASGELYNMYAMTAAHRTMPIPSYARVRNPANGREVIVRVNDRGPFHRERVVDLSYTAALRLGLLGGVAPVEIERITNEAIRTGSWRRGGDGTALALAAPVPTPPALPPAPPVSELARQVVVEPAAMTAATTAAPMPPPAAAPTSPSVPALPAPVAPSTADPAPASPAPVALASSTEPAQRAFTEPQRGFWLQLGAFTQRDGALAFHQKVEAAMSPLAPLLAVFSERSIHRLQAGPYASRAEAASAAERVREALKLVPVVIERR